MSDAERPKRRALGRGITDAIDSPEASATHDLLAKVKPRSLSVTPPTLRTPPTSPTAPERDFTRVANSIVRDAVGYFTGKSKQIYDYLYSKTRGAIIPVRSVKLPKLAIMRGAAIGSERTLLKNLNHLKAIGLIQVSYTDGQHGGNEYEVMLPEEIGLRTARTPPTSPIPQHPPTELPSVPPAESGVGGVGLSTVESTASTTPKTSFKTKEEKTDDDAALAPLLELERELTGRSSSLAWREVVEVLATEFKIAAARTTVSSPAPFLAEHLRRRLFKLDKKQMQSPPTVAEKPATGPQDFSKCPDCGGSGLRYKDGDYSKGVERCPHNKLSKSES